MGGDLFVGLFLEACVDNPPSTKPSNRSSKVCVCAEVGRCWFGGGGDCFEIRVKTEHDFNLEKQTLVHEAKLSIQDEFAKKEKEKEVQDRIARSTEVGECRVKKMKNRDDLLKQLVGEAGSKCAMVARGQNYPQLLQKLMVQSLIKIEDLEVVVHCRGEDKDTIASVLPDAVKEYVEIMVKESGIKLKPVVSINSNPGKNLPETSYGGVVLTADSGKIVCDNTMAARLNLVYVELLPALRAILFPGEQ